MDLAQLRYGDAPVDRGSHPLNSVVDTSKVVNSGLEAGSGAIRGTGPRIRAAGVAARQALLGLASAKLGVPVSALTVSKGVVSGGGQSVKYGDLLGGKLLNVKLPAASLAPGQGGAKAVADYKVVGKRVPRIDIPAKITGQYTYLHNVRVPGMLHGRLVRPRGQGVYGTQTNVPVSVDESSIKHIKGAQVVRVGNFLGVVAPHEYGAIQAAAELKVKWAEDATMAPSGSLWSHMRDDERNGRTTDTVTNKGDVDGALKGASKTVSQTYAYHYNGHMSIGPTVAIADVQPDSATIFSNTQAVFLTGQNVAGILKLDPSKVTVKFFEGSGSYGIGAPWFDAPQAAAIMSKAVGKPVRLQFMRWDEHGWDLYGPAQLMDVRGGVDANGKVVAYDYTALSVPFVAFGAGDTSFELLGNPATATGRWGTSDGSASQYAIANSRQTGKMLPSVKAGYPKVSYLRAPSAPQATFAQEGLLDELAVAAGMDSVAFRRQNITDPRWTGVLDAVAKAANWQSRVSGSAKQSGPVKQGRGVAVGGFAGTCVAVVAEVEVNVKTGKLVAKHLYAAQDNGLTINPGLVENQMSGNLIMAASRALFEQVTTSKSRVTSLDWSSYPIMRFKDAPNVTTIVVDRPEIASSGSGEPATAPVAAALANAFFDATGVRLREAPFTPGRVRAVLKASA